MTPGPPVRPTPQTYGALEAAGPSSGPVQYAPGFAPAPGGGLTYAGMPYAPRPTVAVVPVLPIGPAPTPDFPAVLTPVPVVEVPVPPVRAIEGVPEPSSVLMLGIGLATAGIFALRKRKRNPNRTEP